MLYYGSGCAICFLACGSSETVAEHGAGSGVFISLSLFSVSCRWSLCTFSDTGDSLAVPLFFCYIFIFYIVDTFLVTPQPLMLVSPSLAGLGVGVSYVIA